MANMFEIYVAEDKRKELFYGALLFILSAAVYLTFVYMEQMKNPAQTIFPSFAQMWDGFKQSALEEDMYGDVWMIIDIRATGWRFLVSLAIIWSGTYIGLYMGMFPRIDRFLNAYVTILDKLPAIILLPLFSIPFGVGDASKIAVVVVGVLPTIILDARIRTKGVNRQQIIKGTIMKASSLENAHMILLPKVYPGVLETIKLNFKSIANLILATEMIQASAGMGFRIYTQKRMTEWAVVYPYIFSVIMLLFAAYALLSLYIWYRAQFESQTAN